MSMKKCAMCNGTLVSHFEVSESVRIAGFKCKSCGETFWPSSEMLRWEVLTGRRKTARKVGILGDSLVVRIPKSVAKDVVREGDYALFEKAKEGFLVKIVHPNS